MSFRVSIDTMTNQEESTTRVTIAIYLDDDGQEQRVEVPGWVGAAQALIDHVASTGGGLATVLGQLYMERPYADVADAPNLMTVVDLRSTDGNDRMVQEFAGAIQDETVLRHLLVGRLREESPKWMPVESYVMRR